MPTDERFKALHEEQKLLLFYGFVENPTEDQLHRSYRDQHQGPSFTAEDEENLSRIGYGPDSIARLKSELDKAGIGTNG